MSLYIPAKMQGQIGMSHQKNYLVMEAKHISSFKTK